jgi:hypothetical protein
MSLQWVHTTSPSIICSYGETRFYQISVELNKKFETVYKLRIIHIFSKTRNRAFKNLIDAQNFSQKLEDGE